MKNIILRFIAIFGAIAMLSSVTSLAGDADVEQIKKDLPKLLGANNAGTDFYMTFNPCWETAADGNNVRIYVSSGVETLVTCEVEGKGFKKSKKTVPNDIIEFNLPPGIAQVYKKTDRDESQEEQVYPQYAVHVYADAPIIVYGVTRYQYTSDGFLALPTSALGKEYIVASYGDVGDNGTSFGQYLPSQTAIVAPYDGTKVRFTLGGPLHTQTTGGLTVGETTKETLNRGDVWQFSSFGHAADLSGSIITATKPIGVISGNFCAYIPLENAACDFISEMELPINTWGTKYHVTPIHPRKKNSIVKVFASANDGTRVFRNGKEIGTIPDGGGTKGRGWWFIRLDEIDLQPWVYSSDKPISVTQFNPGQTYDGVLSDPFQLILTPTEQYQDEIVFNTPGIRGGMGYPDNFINLVYLATPQGTIPPDLEFAKVVNGEFEWKQLRSLSAPPGEPFSDDPRPDGRKYYAKTLLLPGDGVYRIRAQEPFAAYAYGFSNWDSYGFPTSVALADLQVPDTLCPVPEFKMDCEGNIGENSDFGVPAIVTDEPRDDDENRSNLALIIFNKKQSYNYDFEYEPFVAGEAKTTYWNLNIQDPSKDARAVISFTDRRGNDTTLVIEYFAQKLSIEPERHDFGKFKLNQDDAQNVHQFYVVNESEKGTAMISRLEFKSNDQNFAMFDYQLPYELEPGEKMPFKVRFNAIETGEFIDEIGVGDTCFFNYYAEVLAVVGNPEILVGESPNLEWDADFGQVTVGQQVSQKISVGNIGSSNLVISGHSDPVNPEFELEFTTYEPTVDNPWILEPGQFTDFKVKFRPTAEIEYTEEIVFYNDAVEIDSIAPIRGVGIKADLTANSYNWLRRTINRPDFPTGPYPVDDGDDPVITLFNGGTKDVLITSLTTVEDIKGDAFKFDRTIFNNYTIPFGEEKFVEATFQPTQVGEHKLVIDYNNNADAPAQTTLQGVGIVPVVSAQDYDFGKTIVFEYDNAQTKVVVFENIQWEYGDALTIYDLEVVDAGTIETDGINYGSEGFTFDKTQIRKKYNDGSSEILDITQTPIVLQPGEKIEIDASFVAQKNGAHTAVLRADTDGWTDHQSFIDISTWTGEGELQGLNPTNAEAQICVGESVSLYPKIENIGTGDVRVTSVEIRNDADGVFQIADADIAQNGFDLPEGGEQEIEVIYTPDAPGGDHQATVIFKNSTINMPEVPATIEGKSDQYHRKTSSSLDKSEVEIGENLKYKITLDPADPQYSSSKDFALATVEQLNFAVTYIGGFAQIVEMGDVHSNFKLSNLKREIFDEAENIWKLTFSINFANGDNDINKLKKDSEIEIVEVIFGTGLPYVMQGNEDADLNAKTSIIHHEVTTVANAEECIEFGPPSEQQFSIKPTCVYDMRKLVVSGYTPTIHPINPNPVGEMGGELEFDVAFSNVLTEIEIYNANGEIVAKPVSGYLNAGNHSAEIPVDNLPSGVYWCKMQSGSYTGTQKLVIVK